MEAAQKGKFPMQPQNNAPRSGAQDARVIQSAGVSLHRVGFGPCCLCNSNKGDDLAFAQGTLYDGSLICVSVHRHCFTAAWEQCNG